MAREFGSDDFFERSTIPGFVSVRNGPDVAVAAVAEDGADGELIRAHFAFCSTVELGDVGFNGLRNNRCRLFLSCSSQDHGEETLGLCRKIAGHGRLERLAVGSLIGLLNGSEICI